MISFIMLPPFVQNLVCFWAILVCFGAVADAMLLWRQKRYWQCVLSAFCFVLGYFMFHVCREGTQLRLKGHASELSLFFLRQPFALFVCLTVFMSAACVLAYMSVRKWEKTHITSASIKESVDSLPVGICYYLDEGRCVLVNHRMSEICYCLTGRDLLNGVEFQDFLKGKSIFSVSDGTAVSFRHRIVKDRGEVLHELIADDITERYQKTEELRSDNEKVRTVAAGMKAYGETIAETVHRQEILQAKMNIHDEMNRMLLVTKRSVEDKSDEAERQAIINMWKLQTTLLCRESDNTKSSNVISDLNTLASAIGVRILWDGEPKTESVQVLTMFLAAARESLTNAAKHAKAQTMTVRVEESRDILRAEFENDGRKPDKPVTETGGLKTLRERIERTGGRMETDITDGFTLTIEIPKEEKTHGL